MHCHDDRQHFGGKNTSVYLLISYSILYTIQVALSGKEEYGSPTAIHTQTNSLETHTYSSYIVMLLTFCHIRKTAFFPQKVEVLLQWRGY